MDDRLRRAGDAIAAAVAPPEAMAQLEGRMRRRARRRRLSAACAAPVAIAAAVVIVAGTIGFGSGAHVSSQPVEVVGGNNPVPVGPLHAVSGPKRYRAVDFADARIWVPRPWYISSTNGLSCAGRPGNLYMDPSSTPTLCHKTQWPEVVVRPLTRRVVAGHRSRINGYNVFSPSRGVYEIPGLGVSVVEQGQVPEQVIDSIGPSLRAQAIASGPVEPVPSGWHRVSYRGVRLDVPSDWPTVSAAHLEACGPTPFFAAPSVFVGNSPGCTEGGGGLEPLTDATPANGLWLDADQTQGGALRTIRTPSGQALQLSVNSRNLFLPVLYLWYHDVTVAVGIGRNPNVARAIFGSITFDRSTPNSRVADACPTTMRHTMPKPTVLKTKLVLSAGEILLEPPGPDAHPVISAATAWHRAGANTAAPGETYQLLLALYSPHSEKVPHTNDQGETPDGAQVLAWIVFGSPTVTKAGACGIYSTEGYNARTGQNLVDAGFYPRN